MAYRVKCRECDWTVCSSERRKSLRSAFYHVVVTGHEVNEMGAIEEEFGL